MSLFLLGAGGYWLVLAINVWKPRYRPPLLAVISFFPAWLLTERLPIRLLMEVGLVAALVALGAMAAWPGWVGLGLCVVAWSLMGGSLQRSRRASAITERALQSGLGEDYRLALPPERVARFAERPRWPEIWIPWPLRPGDVEKQRRIPYRRVGERTLEMDVIRGRETPPGAPILMFIHGGGWVIGHKEKQGLPLMYHLAQQGWVCFSPSYRLAPGASLTDMILDLKDAVRWIREHASEYGGDASFLAVSGGSAGAHLASLLALTGGDPQLQPGFEDADTALQACVSFYGIYDLLDDDGVWPHGGMKRLLERQVVKASRAERRDLYEAYSPLHRIQPGAPPFCLLHGELDNLAPVAQARTFAARLGAASRSPVVYVEYPTAHHAFEVFPSIRCMAAVHGAARFLAVAHTACARSGVSG